MFLPPDGSFLSREKRALSTRSFANLVAVLSYSCPLNDLPSPAGLSSVDSCRICLEARIRRHGEGVGRGDLRRWERKAREGTRFGNDIAGDSID